ncbi:hypothetical protein L486_03487 [Kwoniella mangroviensis CBS 10435]|uniref:Uncharacterized protein n=1 Tax=Kwoniella mangroviensis CBS 10435 TaxID=1331196 RepID=A0A1B9ITW5_9TREE|nr:uncharacterized protein I203_02175 [Kwoniella mangroviensis CBS 8507]OCF58989.1 hypothetical protein L486_03487 [Kwoniella mangroviensis CBS 10435]OCF68784.1 hypothetical protein I203_02175 [Kwoniella mangroviensis CBS 8507]OCF76756.1 hypothetical protein I204_02457 [Kwoniella mangroviensis CBS 8886]
MESLSPECTPLKHRYDSCFNAWFEGYLQPALAAASSLSSSSTSSNPSPITPTTPQLPLSTTSTPPTPQINQTIQREPLVTSWASAFPSRRLFARKSSSSTTPTSGAQGNGQPVQEEEHHWYNFALSESEPEPESEIVSEAAEAIDTKGKSRSQIKAEEYQRNCGRFWEDYQGCLKNAINQNESLSALLETAREEHPLGSLDGLKGTPWDSKADFTKEQE